MWSLQEEGRYKKSLNKYVKRHRHEVLSILSNLDKYFTTLLKVGDVAKVTGKYIHDEKKGY